MNQDAFLANTRKTGWPATRRGLLKKLGGQMRLMGQVRAATGREEQGGVYAWLLDNFYVLEREYKQLCHTIRGLSDPEGFARLAQAFHLSLCRERKPLNSGTVSTIIAQKNSERELNWEQFTLCEAALRLSLLTEAGEAAAAPDAPDAAERIGYAVNGLYAVGSIDFLQIIQNYSTVEAILRQDPAGVYPNMDPASQGQYRERIYRLSRQEGISETALARRLIDLAQSEEEPPKNHVGYPLLHAPALTRPQKRRAALYLFLLPAASLLLSFLAGWYTNSVLTGVFCLLPVYELLRPICQSLCVRGMRAGFIPKMDVDKLPSDMKGTLVAVSLLLEPAGVGEKIEKRLTELYFSNREEGLCFGMLADLPSAKVPHTAQDDAMIR